MTSATEALAAVVTFIEKTRGAADRDAQDLHMASLRQLNARVAQSWERAERDHLVWSRFYRWMMGASIVTILVGLVSAYFVESVATVVTAAAGGVAAAVTQLLNVSVGDVRGDIRAAQQAIVDHLDALTQVEGSGP